MNDSNAEAEVIAQNKAIVKLALEGKNFAYREYKSVSVRLPIFKRNYTIPLQSI